MKTRGEEVGTGETIQLKVLFSDNSANPVDLDAFPTIQIVDSSGAIYMPPTSVGVYRMSTGLYAFDFTTPINGPQGTWSDYWAGLWSGTSLTGSFMFIVSNIPLPGPVDGYEQLGDVPTEELTQTTIHNVNILMNLLRKRLQSTGWHRTVDVHGNTVYENCDIFSVDELYNFLCLALGEFNQTPHFTNFTFDNDAILYFRDVIVEGGFLQSISSKALIEKGREFNITDNGLSFTPPQVADMLINLHSALLGPYRDKLKAIKYQFKSFAGIGTYTITNGINPAINRLRHLRSRRLI